MSFLPNNLHCQYCAVNLNWKIDDSNNTFGTQKKMLTLPSMSKLTPGDNPDLVHLFLTGLKTFEMSHVTPLGRCRNLLCSRRGRLCRMIINCSLFVDGSNTYRRLETGTWCNAELTCTACNVQTFAIYKYSSTYVIFLWQMLGNYSFINQLNQHITSQGLDPESWIAERFLSFLECGLDWKERSSSGQNPVIVLTSVIYNTSRSKCLLSAAFSTCFTTCPNS